MKEDKYYEMLNLMEQERAKLERVTLLAQIRKGEKLSSYQSTKRTRSLIS